MKTEKKAGFYKFWRPKDGSMRGMEIEGDRAILSIDNFALGVLYGDDIPRLREEQEYLLAAANACKEAGIPTEALESGVVGEMREALEAEEWNFIWKIMNAFASGDTQNQWSRTEPIAVLGEVYQALAIIDGKRRKSLAKAKGAQ